jgi:hypothetical protein
MCFYFILTLLRLRSILVGDGRLRQWILPLFIFF